jgi:hypothetical protein
MPLIAKWKDIRSSDVVALNDMMKKDVPAIYLAPTSDASTATQTGGQNHKN